MNSLVFMCVLVAGASAFTSPLYRGTIGASGIVRPDGNNVQFTQAQVDNFVLVGPSGIVTRDGKNIQLTDDLQFVQRAKRSAGFVSPKGNVGHSGILRADGSTTLFTHDQAHNIAVIGPSGIVFKDGNNFQFTDDLNIANSRTKRHLIGESGMITNDGQNIQFKEAGVHIILEGPSGFLLSDGTQVQKRAKRHLIGPSGMVTDDGQLIQFTEAGVHITLEGPSGFLLSDGTQVQRRSKRSAESYGHSIGHSGIVTKDGRLIQLEHGVTVVNAGPSGVVLSNGQNIQF